MHSLSIGLTRALWAAQCVIVKFTDRERIASGRTRSLMSTPALFSRSRYFLHALILLIFCIPFIANCLDAFRFMLVDRLCTSIVKLCTVN